MHCVQPSGTLESGPVRPRWRGSRRATPRPAVGRCPNCIYPVAGLHVRRRVLAIQPPHLAPPPPGATILREEITCMKSALSFHEVLHDCTPRPQQVLRARTALISRRCPVMTGGQGFGGKPRWGPPKLLAPWRMMMENHDNAS
eukprot:scaffold596_cov378-Prasinococcus_capsulatus_cf.AAC.7